MYVSRWCNMHVPFHTIAASSLNVCIKCWIYVGWHLAKLWGHEYEFTEDYAKMVESEGSLVHYEKLKHHIERMNGMGDDFHNKTNMNNLTLLYIRKN